MATHAPNPDDAGTPAAELIDARIAELGDWRGETLARVRAALALVARGAAPYGIVYATDVRAAPGLMIAGVFPARSHPPIVYPIARLRGGKGRDAEGFRRFLLSADGRAILRRHGFASR